MPVEIKELVIRAVVQQEDRPGTATVDRQGKPRPAGEREAIVEEAVKEVLRILRASQER